MLALRDGVCAAAGSRNRTNPITVRMLLIMAAKSHEPFRPETASTTQPAMKQTPPIGVTAPHVRFPVSAST